jgi:hypothetical protein
MKQALLLLLVAALMAATPAIAQYMFFDSDGDGVCGVSDYVPYGDATADVWIDTIHNQDGSTATCATGEDLSIAGYDVVIAAGTYGPASIVLHGWTNAVTEFTQEVGIAQEGDYLWAGFQSGGAATYLPPGKYKLGTVSFTASGSGCASIGLMYQATISGTPHFTEFWSQCPGAGGDNYRVLGIDFLDACRLGGICEDAAKTTWGKIKERYMH